MSNWKMMTFTGSDQKGIVAAVTRVLEQNQYNLGETNMVRLAGNFTMMIMAQSTASKTITDEQLKTLFVEVLKTYALCMHINVIATHNKEYRVPNINIAIHCADRTGIVADVTDVLQKLGFNILDLYSDMGGEGEQTFYVLNIEGESQYSCDELETKMKQKLDPIIKIVVSNIDLMIA